VGGDGDVVVVVSEGMCLMGKREKGVRGRRD